MGLDPMRMPRFRAIGIAMAMALLAPAAPHARAAGLDLDHTGRRLELEGVPSFMASMGDERFVFGFPENDATRLSVIDLGADPPAEVARSSLRFPVLDGQVDFSGQRLVAVGNADGRSWIASLDPTSGGGGVEQRLPMTLANPLVAVDAAGVARVADAGLGRVFTLDGDLFRDARDEARVARTQFFDSAGGVGSLHVTADGQFTFVGDHASTRLSILDASGRVLDTLGKPATSNRGRVAGQATVSFHDGSQGVSAPASLLMADYASETLRVIDFEPILGALSVTATAPIGLPIQPGSVVATDPVGATPLSPILLGASADEGTIAVGNLFSTAVLFFSRTGSVLERIGSATTPRPPAGILVSRTGKTIVVSYPDASFVTIFSLSGPETTAEGGSRLVPGGSRAVRDIQKALDELGYPIGVVDGYAGPRTMQSLDALREKTGRGIDLAKPAEALETLRSLRVSPRER